MITVAQCSDFQLHTVWERECSPMLNEGLCTWKLLHLITLWQYRMGTPSHLTTYFVQHCLTCRQRRPLLLHCSLLDKFLLCADLRGGDPVLPACISLFSSMKVIKRVGGRTQLLPEGTNDRIITWTVSTMPTVEASSLLPQNKELKWPGGMNRISSW